MVCGGYFWFPLLCAMLTVGDLLSNVTQILKQVYGVSAFKGCSWNKFAHFITSLPPFGSMSYLGVLCLRDQCLLYCYLEFSMTNPH